MGRGAAALGPPGACEAQVTTAAIRSAARRSRCVINVAATGAALRVARLAADAHPSAQAEPIRAGLRKKFARIARPLANRVAYYPRFGKWLPYTEVDRVARFTGSRPWPSPLALLGFGGVNSAQAQDWTDYLHWPYVPPQVPGNGFEYNGLYDGWYRYPREQRIVPQIQGPYYRNYYGGYRVFGLPPSPRLARLEQEEILPGLPLRPRRLLIVACQRSDARLPVTASASRRTGRAPAGDLTSA